MWDAHQSWEAVSDEDRKRFRGFLLTDEVIHWHAANLYINAFVAVCSLLPICWLGWDTRKCVVIFLSQHGKLNQPWGVKILKGIKRKLFLPAILEWHVAHAA